MRLEVNQLLEKVDLRNSAVLVIDVQNDFCHQNGASAQKNDVSLIQKTVPNVKKFLLDAQRAGVPIIYIRTEHSRWTDSPSWRQRTPDAEKFCRAGSWGAEFYEIFPEPGAYVVTKHRYSAFIDTDLDLVLRSIGARTIVLTGFGTTVCVESTVRDGFMKDYYVVLLEDCTASETLAEYEAGLARIARRYGVVTSSQVLVEALEICKKGDKA